MCWNGRVYFLSDRDDTMNVWSMDENGRDLRQHTQHKGWERPPSLGRADHLQARPTCASSTSPAAPTRLDIGCLGFDQARETWVKKPMDYLTSVALSPKGDRVALTARGQVFVAPAKQGRLVEVTRTAGVRYRRATFLPDGKGLVALSDESGEVEIWRLPANGVGRRA
jgi:tricorn protease